MKIHFLRNATWLLELKHQRILIDPMLGSKDSFDSMPWTSDGRRNPLIDLPIDEFQLIDILQNIDAILLTHSHIDHWDQKAVELIDKDQLIFVQPEDKHLVESQGFRNVMVVKDMIFWQDLMITRTAGQHGLGEIGKIMAPVSGYIIDDGLEKVYVAGDTVWCEEVESVLEEFRPGTVVLNSGSAQFDHTGHITMNTDDIETVINKQIAKRIIIVHLEAINHCKLERKDLREFMQKKEFKVNWFIPDDGELIELN